MSTENKKTTESSAKETTQTMEFKAEVSRVLEIVIHSL